ncbi:sensor histidine kinase [Agrobacterium fabrum]|uniref:sensor histidine kinase n=1 Tax=Agrobacterium fabrum TaxID=1176649 RepID=UPI001FCD2C4D|nr:HWE histidine kinase domain-containing protein [Agrobacterium fabrum]MDH6296148.1 two-component sensor histidine kinase/CheY-like chemotaxis protein [Agrobacterium fabrum]
MADETVLRMEASRLLLLEDSSVDAELIEEQLSRLSPPPEVTRAVGKAPFIEALEKQQFDIILADFSLPDFDGMSALDLVMRTRPDTPFIFVSGILGEDAAIDAFRRGATDYVLKQRLVRLPSAVERALAEAREKQERKRAELHKELLVRELSHRVKNTMAMVVSIIRRTAKGSTSIKDYQERLVARVSALAESHALLFQSNWGETNLRDVVKRAIEPHNTFASRVELEGPDGVHVSPKSALALGMILHELATNAQKYGSLSGPNGKVEVFWKKILNGDGNDCIDLRWQESGGPPVSVPQDTGFGTTLITRGVQYELQAESEIRYDPDGLQYRVIFPLD